MPNHSVVGFAGGEFRVAASARETGKKWDIWDQLGVPPLAEASCGAIDIRIAEATAKAMLQPFIGDLPELREALMRISSRSKQVY
jgi:hypothetical protein